MSACLQGVFMKKTNLIISALFVMCMTSCAFVDAANGFFTSSWGTGLKRDLSETYGKMESKELAGMINDPAIMNDKAAGQQLLVELGKRDDVKNLSAEDKNSVMNLMINSSIDAETIASVVSELTKSDSSQSANPEEIAKEIISSIDKTDVEAVKQILKDTEHLDDVDPSSAALATVCLVAQVAKNVDSSINYDIVQQKVEDIMNASDDSTRTEKIDDAKTSLGLSDDDVDSLKVAVNAAVKLGDLNAEVFPGITIKSLFGGAGA